MPKNAKKANTSIDAERAKVDAFSFIERGVAYRLVKPALSNGAQEIAEHISNHWVHERSYEVRDELDKSVTPEKIESALKRGKKAIKTAKENLKKNPDYRKRRK